MLRKGHFSAWARHNGMSKTGQGLEHNGNCPRTHCECVSRQTQSCMSVIRSRKPCMDSLAAAVRLQGRNLSFTGRQRRWALFELIGNKRSMELNQLLSGWTKSQIFKSVGDSLVDTPFKVLVHSFHKLWRELDLVR